MSNTMIVIILVAINGIIIKELGYFLFGTKKPNEILNFLENFMPMLIMIILVCFLYKDLDYKNLPYSMDYIISGFFSLIFYIVFKKTYIAIILATLIFYILHDIIFINVT
ncbi:AzlD domain-containing protein [Campylobacter sp. MG1]|uniref:AzlD domain-containing protein n=1 Tax=Campylobacter sp. MG1 TaxID=2976332 RepID=UPI00226D2F32|nr:AzlD domain-containing protein [Campylobacter sp. MG1]